MSVIVPMLMLSLVSCAEEEVEVEEAPKVVKKASKPGDANVTDVYVREEKDGTWTFHVTVEHPDKNWFDYADGWDVVLPDGTAILPDAFHQYTKHLRTPQTDAKKPIVRTQKKIEIPEGVDKVRVRAHDKKDGWGGAEIEVDLNVRFGTQFSVKRAL
jgi:hypothetical protein